MKRFSWGTIVEQGQRSWIICKKNIRIYYLKGPVVIFGILLPLFLFGAFIVGRELSITFFLSGLLAMTIFFTATAVVPLITPWEARMRTLERLVSTPVSIVTIVMGDILASFLFGVFFSLVPLVIFFLTGVSIMYPLVLLGGILLASFCFSSLAAILSSPPVDTPANVMMLSTLIKFPLLFISGIFIPIEKLPEWGKVIALASPLTYFTDLVRYSIGGQSYSSPMQDVVILAIFTFCFLTLAVKLHKKTMSKRF